MEAVVRFWERPLQDRIITAGLGLTALAVTTQTGVYLVNAFLLDARVYNLDIDQERTPFTWASVVATFAVAYAASVLALLWRRAAPELAVLAVLACYLSVDDALELHERLGHSAGQALGLERYADRALQPVFVLPIAMVVFVLLWRVAGRSPDRISRIVRTGLALLAVGLLVEVLARVLDLAPPSAADTIEVAVEEGMELAGWMLAAVGLTALLAPSDDVAGLDRTGEALRAAS